MAHKITKAKLVKLQLTHEDTITKDRKRESLKKAVVVRPNESQKGVTIDIIGCESFREAFLLLQDACIRGRMEGFL